MDDNVKNLIGNSMKNWQSELKSGGVSLGNVNINRGIFQGDSLSPMLFIIALIPLSMILRNEKAAYDLGEGKGTVNHLLFMDDLKVYGKTEKQLETLVNSVRIFSEDIKMEFGLSKCGILIMKKGKHYHSEGIQLPNDEVMREIDMEEGYKYLGILEADGIKNKTMKEKITTEYYRRVRKILKSKLNGMNITTAINSRAVSIVRYSAGIIKWTKEELEKMDRKSRKLLSIYRALHPQADVDRLYVKRSLGGRGMISIEDCVKVEINNLREYTEGSNERLKIAVVAEDMLAGGKEKKEVHEERLNKYKEKRLHGQFYRSIEEKRDKISWNWLKNGDLKKETEGMLMAAQDQALRTRHIRKVIDKEDIDGKCRLCGERDETIAHIVSECKKLAQKYYKDWRHDKVAIIIHWQLCKKFGMEHAEKWYEHTAESVVENEDVKILWDMKLQIDKIIECSKPDIVVLYKQKRSCIMIDVACPFDTRITEKEQEKIEKYHDLRMEIKRIWKCREVKVIPVIIGALGTVSRKFEEWLDQIEIEYNTTLLQKLVYWELEGF